ncbi:transposase, MuDR, MULE transposase domain protein [Tanacetum coccineum]
MGRRNPSFDENPELMTEPINTKGETALMIAVGTNRSHNFVEKLVHRVKHIDGAAEKLFCKSSSGNSPLHQAAKIGNTKDAMILVEQNINMTRELDVNHHTPLIWAARHRNKSTLQYLLKVTPAETISLEEGISSLYAGIPGGDLITFTIQAGFLDIQMNKRSGKVVQIDTFPKIISGFWSVLQCLAPSIKNIHDMKVKHSQSKLLAELICERVTEVDDSNKVLKILGSAAFTAVQHGIPEVVKECLVKYPDIISYKRDNPDNRDESYLPLEVITQRQEKVYNVIWQSFDHKVFQATLIDEKMENSLHKAGMLAPPHRLNVVNGAALQMQRELQWYKIRTFINYLRPLLIVDAAHLKGLYKGTNLVAVGMDGNNQIVPIAFGICKGETGPCWSWWLCVLKECIGDNLNLLFISDRHPSIDLAAHDEFPLAFHADVQPDVYHKLCQAGPQRWSIAHCLLVRYNYMTSNSVGSVNACTVMKRKLPVTILAETYRALVQDWYFKRREHAANMTYEITDWVADKVHKRKLKRAAWIVHGLNQYQYQVSDGR